MCDNSLQRRGPRTRSSRQAETAAERTKAECASASRPRLKRKYEESSSLETCQCQILHYQLPQEVTTVQHEDLSLHDSVKDEVKDEPSDTMVNEELLDVSKCESGIKQEQEETRSEMLLFDNPDPESLDDVEESIVNAIPESSINSSNPESSAATIPESSSIINTSNEYIKIIDIQEIFKRNTSENNIEDGFRIENVMSLTPQNIDSVDTKCNKPAQSKDSQESANQKLKNSFFIRCEQCKQFLSSEASAKTHKCTAPPKLITIKTWSNLSEASLNGTLNPPTKNQNALLNQPIMLYFDPHIQDLNNPKIVPKFNSVGTTEQHDLVIIAPKHAQIKTTVNDCYSFPSAAHEKFYRHFCKYHFKFKDHQIMSPTITVPHLIQSFSPYMNSLDLYQCQQCAMMYKSTSELKLHLFKVHRKSDTDIVQCKVCGFHQEFRYGRVQDHVSKHKDHFNHFVLPGVVWRCLKCEILSKECITVDKTEILLHLKNVIITRKHRNFKQRHSIVFDYKIDSLLPEDPHIRQSYSCICMDTFETQYDLNEHLHESHVDYVFRKCSGCQIKCYNMNLYYSHLENTHISSLMQDVDLRNKKELRLLKNKEFKCNRKSCAGAKFVNGCSLQLHVVQQHNLGVARQNLDRQKLKCPFCEVYFDQKLFYAHYVPYIPMVPDLQKGLCRICNMVVSGNLEHHITNEHNVPIVYCLLCKSNILCKKEAFLHLKSCYSLEAADGQDFICPICGFICDDLDFLINHIRVDLEALQPNHQCKFCLNLFYTQFNLSWHLCDAKCVQR